MKKVVTTDYYISEGELREIIAKWFKVETGKSVALCNIEVKIKQETSYSAPSFDCININLQEEVPCE